MSNFVSYESIVSEGKVERVKF